MAEAVTAAVAIGWGMRAAGWVASPIISDLFKKASSYLGFDASEKLIELEPKILLLERVMGAVEESPYRPRLEGLYSKLKSAFYDAEEILDDVEYYRLEKKIQDDKLKSEVTGPSRRLKEIWSAVAKSSPLKHQESGMPKVKLKKKLDRIEEVINDACKVLELMNLPSISGANQSHVVAANSRGSGTTSRPLSQIIGRDEDCDKIVAMLHEKNEHGQPDTNSAPCYSVVGIHGIGGSGKSTLAQLVCAREKKDSHFDLVMWVHVSQDFSVRTIFMEIFEAATGTLCTEFKNPDTLQDKLEEKLRGKCFLLVLDDVWYNIRDVTQSENLQRILSPLKAGEAGSKILVTSRTEDALLALGAPKHRCIPMSVLDEDVFSNLLMHYGLHGVPIDDYTRRMLEDIGKEIAKKLKGSPLAARIVGEQLRLRQNVEFWRSVRDRDLLNETMGALWWSYHHLREQVKRCFAYCSIFPRRHCLERHELVQLWAAEGFARCTSEGEEMEDVCQEYFDELLSTSFLQLKAMEYPHEKDYYLVHDLLHDLAEKAAGSDSFRIENSLELQGKWPALPPNVRHIFVQTYDEELITKKICQLHNLHTLIIGRENSLEAVGEQVLKCMFKKLRKLRVLIITARDLMSYVPPDVPVPACIGQLRHLRYLAFRSEIYHARDLRIILPATFNKLYHMQILDFSSANKVVFSCEDICSLINLRHVVCFEDVDIPSIGKMTSLRMLGVFNVRKEQAHELKQLRNVNKLRGKLCIRCLENVESKAEALEANLAGKEGLSTLKLSWRSGEASPEVQAEVIEGLCPPKDLESLTIEDYKGPRYPSWMHNDGPKHVNHLELIDCSPQPGPELGGFCTCLRELTISSCSWAALPDYMEHLTSLRSLEILYCHNIQSLPALPQSLEHLTLNGCRVVSMSSCRLEHLTLLQTLDIWSCDSIRSLPALPQSLQHFTLRNCNDVLMRSCCMKHLTSLQSLEIYCCDCIWSLPALPQSIKKFNLITGDKELVSSCITVGDPDWQKIKHIPYASIEDVRGSYIVMKMGVV
ncbi:putative disease resistance RPP13-like protein 1 isoform X2 [Lolium perenne]|uniref:putative disease resistance RPP13-like protein 1 isoform X2 n=1 Tax=Lolium perenne TaxID=4522 RepID=UPI0021F5FCE4|nr:putative disease resistance protein RGA3 isoform X2 [Lolium perenne]